MEQVEKKKEEVKETISVAKKDIAPKKEVEVTKQELDPKIVKELEELRQFKAKVEGDKKKEVKVSDTFFSRNEKIVTQPKSNMEKEWEDLFKQGIPRRSE